MDFIGKVVIVTGSSTDIGATTAVLFAKHGASLTIVGSNETRLQEVSTMCQAYNGRKPLCFQMDLTIDKNCETLVKETFETFGRIDVLVNCTEKNITHSTQDNAIDFYDKIIKHNLRVPYKLSHLCVPHLTATKGNIVNIFESISDRAQYGFIPYDIVNSGMDRFTKSAAIELATEGVRVNSVRAGQTASYPKNSDSITGDQHTPTTEAVKPEEVAKMVVFIASNLCPNINGADMQMYDASSFYLNNDLKASEKNI